MTTIATGNRLRSLVVDFYERRGFDEYRRNLRKTLDTRSLVRYTESEVKFASHSQEPTAMATRKLARQPIARQPAPVGKDYFYDPEMRAFPCYYDGKLISIEMTSFAAQAKLDAHVYALLSHQPPVRVTEASAELAISEAQAAYATDAEAWGTDEPVGTLDELDTEDAMAANAAEDAALAVPGGRETWEAQAQVDAAIAAKDKPALSAAAEALVEAIAEHHGGREALRPEAAGELAAALSWALDTTTEIIPFAETTETPTEVVTRVSIFDALCEVVDEAYARHARDTKRLDRLARAWGWLLEQEVYAIYGDRLRVESATLPGTIYYVRATHCACSAWRDCWHLDAVDLLGRARGRAAAGRFRLVNTRTAAPLQPTFGSARGGKSAQDEVNELFA